MKRNLEFSTRQGLRSHLYKMAGEAKGFLYTWCGKQKKVQPKYEILPEGPQRFNYKVIQISFDIYMISLEPLEWPRGCR